MRINARTLLIIGATLLGLYLVYKLSDIVSYVLIAWVLSLLGRPVSEFLKKILTFRKIKPGNTLLAFLTMLLFFLVLTILFWLFVPLVIEQANNLSKVDISALNNTLHIPLNELKNWLVQYGLISPTVDIDQQILANIKKFIEPSKVGAFFTSAVGAVGNAVIAATSIMFILFFFLKDQTMFDDFLKSLLPKKYEDHVIKALHSISTMLRSYFGGIVLQVSILTVLISVALTILGIKNALLIAFFGALMNVIPYIGIVIAMLFGVMITISSNLDLNFYTEIVPMIIKVLLTFGATQLVDNFLVQPYVYSKSVDAHPLEIFLVIMVAGKTGGILAMLIAIPSYTALKLVAKVFFNQWRIVQHITGGLDEPDRE
ncbi:MAG TPA: AI-2E family transporter [Saprospiraceae bacterium]|jgi:predicted PurR-regulated permease PerM|nr:AI-2E family transporter [Saprospiraceae bacterium]MCC6688316.1 AI-2E family transporter [Saprospiraceae bacterium]HMX82724.1 AI-2E family transporter [Saprospiraceae bacterium]HMX85639.1 AI-2E family transporter [Saprospiraceae bacterium]HMZ74217.1 AI-2E family transporter [Saprospiraceae bacterium]